MQQVIIVTDKINMLPCPNCQVSCEEKMECPVCHTKFCNHCFQEVTESDGNSIQCPECKEILALP